MYSFTESFRTGNDTPYAALHCLSNFSFLKGASHPEELVQRAADLGLDAMALTDECSLAGVVRAHQHIKQHALPLKLIIGAEFHLADGTHLVVLARNRQGYAQLSRLITQARRRADKGCYQVQRADFTPSSMSDCLSLLVPGESDPVDTEKLQSQALWLQQAFPERAWLAIELLHGYNDAHRLKSLSQIAQHCKLPCLASIGVLMHIPERRPVADVLTVTRLHCTLEQAGLRLSANAERHLHTPASLHTRYPEDLLTETIRVSDACHFNLDEIRYEYPDGLVPAGYDEASWLRELVQRGLKWRQQQRQQRNQTTPDLADTSPISTTVLKQIEHELALIAELNYEAYFLTVHDIVQFARQRGILCQGRGSAANSAVCWALGITEVDPELGCMLFERFISRERGEPPDIDVDFEHHRREEVVQYIYDRYGRTRAALAATVIRYRVRSALRDVGRALGLPLHEVEKLTRDRFWFDGQHILPERMREAGFDPNSRIIRQLMQLTETLVGFPRHLSQHVGGFVIARQRLDELVPIENAAMPGRTVIQWDKDDLDALGLLKIDILALGMLSVLKRSLTLLSQRRQQPFGLGDIPREAPAVYDMLSSGDAVGVFQVESRAQLSMLPRLKPQRFYDLVVEVAIVRPGPIQGGMVHPYLKAREHVAAGGRITYPHPSGDAPRAGVQNVLQRTLGVPIFQEQVMQLAVVAAGFSPGEADQLRRSMGAWRRKGELAQYREKLIAGMHARGYAPEFAQRLCSQIEGFGSYGFPESHAASFALLVYFSAWLKCFEPAVFLCSLLNSQPMGFYAPAQLIQDARRHDVIIRETDVTASDWDSNLETVTSEPARSAVRLGLNLIKGISADTAERIVTARRKAPFYTIDDLATRAALSGDTLSRLAEAGALAQLSHDRRQALWDAVVERAPNGLLCGVPVMEPAATLQPPSEAEDLLADYACKGFTLGRHPLALLRQQLTSMRFETAQCIHNGHDRQVIRAAGIVTCRQRPGSANGTMFLTLEDETGLLNVIVHPGLLDKQRRELLSARLLGVFGQLTRQGPVVHLVAGRVVDHSALLGHLQPRSRDFH